MLEIAVWAHVPKKKQLYCYMVSITFPCSISPNAKLHYVSTFLKQMFKCVNNYQKNLCFKKICIGFKLSSKLCLSRLNDILFFAMAIKPKNHRDKRLKSADRSNTISFLVKMITHLDRLYLSWSKYTFHED